MLVPVDAAIAAAGINVSSPAGFTSFLERWISKMLVQLLASHAALRNLAWMDEFEIPRRGRSAVSVVYSATPPADPLIAHALVAGWIRADSTSAPGDDQSHMLAGTELPHSPTWAIWL